MVALNFSPRFAPDVEDNIKRQTIRETTKARAGCTLQLYTGQRTKSCRKLLTAVCISVQPIILMKTLVQPAGNTAITGMFLEEFAKVDGFKSYAEMWKFFEPRANEHNEFNGYLIRW